MIILCTYQETITSYGETILISIVASGVFSILIYCLGLLYDWLKYSKLTHTFEKFYKGDNEKLKGRVAATAKVTYNFRNELKLSVRTLINTDSENPGSHYEFQEDNIQEWEGKVTMENSEAGKLYFYYTKPENLKAQNRSDFKRILFLHNAQFLILFGEGKWENKNEEFKRTK